jgi:hypothetical protein
LSAADELVPSCTMSVRFANCGDSAGLNYGDTH